MKGLLYTITVLSFIGFSTSFAQCDINTSASQYEIYCGESVDLTAFGSSTGEVVLAEDFESGGFGPGWNGSPQATFSSPGCTGGPGPNGDNFFAWMGDAQPVPRTITSQGYDLSAATAGVSVCFDLLFAEQGGGTPCEGPDEPDEGVFLEYSTDGGNNWIEIHYFDPNGGYDDDLINWNNWCFELPSAAITGNTMIRWNQTADSGEEYDHWGIDNVEIFQNDINAEVIWLHDGYSYGVGNPGGVNPTPVTPTTTTTYTAQITTGTGDVCTQDLTVTVLPPVYESTLAANPTSICQANSECADITGDAKIIISPAEVKTFENNQTELVASGSAAVNINIQDLNMTTVEPNSITEICVNGFNFSGTEACLDFFNGCDCNGVPISAGESCDVDASSFNITVISPSGCEILLVPKNTITTTGIQDMCFVPSGGAAIGSGSGAYTGSFASNDPFSNMDGCDANGTWTLDFNTGTGGLGVGLGSLSGWSITFDDIEISQPVNATWSPSGGVSDPNSLNPQICQAGAYTVTLDNGVAGCPTYEEQITITDNCGGCTAPAISTSDIDNCGSTVDLTTGLTEPGGTTVTFHASQADADAGANPITNTQGPGTYFVRVEDGADPTCFATDQITVNDLSVDASFVFPTTACNTDPNPTPTSTTVAGGTYTVDNGGTINATTGELDLTGTNGTETFVITYTLDNGTCNDAQTQTINLTTCATCSASAVSNNPTACGATDGTLVITVSTADADYNVSIDGAPATQYTATGTTITIPGYGGGDVVTSVDVEEISSGCTDSDNTGWSFVAPGSPTVTVNNMDATACNQSTATLDATTTSGNLTWSDDLGNNYTNGDVVNPTQTTIYTATADDNGCLASGAFTITISPNPTVTVTPVDPTSCNATDGELQLVITPAGTYDVLIDATTNNGQVSDGTTAIVFGGYGSATISSVTVTDPASTCNIVDNTGWTLTAPGAPTADAGPDATICDNGSHVLAAVNPSGTATTVEWTGGLADGSTVSPTSTTTYTLSITENGCTATDDMIVNVNATPVVSLNSSDAEYCDGDPITALSASTTGGTITWYDLNTVSQGTGTSLTPTVGVGGTSCYQVQADNNGCVSPLVGPVCVTVNANPVAPVITGNNSFCTGDAIDLTTGDANTQWYSDAALTTSLINGDTYSTTATLVTTAMVYAISVDPVTGCTSPPSNFTYNVLQGGFLDVVDTIRVCEGSPYSVSAVASDTVDWGNGVRSFDYTGVATADTVLFPTVNSNCGPVTQPVVIIASPNPTVNAGADQVITRGELVDVEGTGAVTYEWELINNTAGVNYLNCPTCQSTEGYILFTSLYVLNGWNEYGCVDTDTLLITVDGMINAYTPNIFSPNGDGENDVFRVEGPDFYSFSMMIFNRWGELIYETTDNTEGWDGTWRNKEAGTGVYTYVVEGRAVTGEDVTFGGNVTLVR